MEDKNISKELLVDEWLECAEDDELNAQSILKHRDGTPRGACFMSQQMAEKYFKAFLVHTVRRFPKIHILEHLLTLCAKNDASFDKLKNAAVFLDTFYVPVRYPADFPEGFSWNDAEQAFSSATRIKKFVLDKLN